MREWEEWEMIGGKEFPNLRDLSLSCCPKLKGNLPRNLPSLTALYLWRCSLLLESGRYSDGNSSSSRRVKWSDQVFRQLMQPPLLMSSGPDSDDISSNIFSQWMLALNSLRKLIIKGFPSLKSLPKVGLQKNLQSLTIDNCPNLEFLPNELLHNYTWLEDLTIENSCDSMTSFALDSLPILKSLCLRRCKNLTSVFAVEDASLWFLQSIEISECRELESLWLGGLPSTPNLIRLKVIRCEKLESLPEPIHTLTGLQDLTIHGLPNLNLEFFAREGLPVNLRKLDVMGNVGGNTAALQRLTSLSELRLIRCEDMVKKLINTQEALLPTSLVSLQISEMNDIKSLEGSWLQHLTSLQQLDISNCRSLESLPEQGLIPSSLMLLTIKQCPLLIASCLRKQGKERCKIAHIPFIYINGNQLTI